PASPCTLAPPTPSAPCPVRTPASPIPSQRPTSSATEAPASPPSRTSSPILARSISKPATAKPDPRRRCASACPSRPTPINPTGLRSGIALLQRLDAEIARGAVEAVAQRFGHRDAVLDAVLPLPVALLSPEPDAFDPRPPL